MDERRDRRVLRLSAESRARIAAWARARSPREACGLLIGRRDGDGAVVAEVSEARNRSDDVARFVLDAVDHLAAEERASAHGLAVVGIWHSHPDGSARPSEEDRAAAWSGWSHVIVAVADERADELRSWRLVDGRLVEELVVE